ncbi:TetR/AcrR family transcriptional regulator [Haliangium sp.]|uniref:TetR/AcrR family transcriptional regulator n=1 Tax=Haliangium sp. TaxID=2663208 RepID=UPI003D148242
MTLPRDQPDRSERGRVVEPVTSDPAAGGGDDGGDDRRVQRRRQIIEVAKGVFAEMGYHHASINEIIGRAQIARGTFYLYFSNKHKVFDAILDEALRELRGRITRIQVGDPAKGSPEAQLRQNLVRVLTYVFGDQPLTKLLLDHSQSPQSEVAERVGAFFAGISALLAASLEYGIAAGMVRPCNTRLVAAALLGAVRGVVFDVLEADAAPDIEAIADELLAFAKYGVFRA